MISSSRRSVGLEESPGQPSGEVLEELGLEWVLKLGSEVRAGRATGTWAEGFEPGEDVNRGGNGRQGVEVIVQGVCSEW